MAFGIPNIERAVSNFLEGGTGITAIREISVEARYMWAVEFEDVIPPTPFNILFPASDVSIPLATIDTETMQFGQTHLQTPFRDTTRTMEVTFYDDQKRTLQKYFRDWMNLDIKNNGQFMSGLNDNHTLVTRFDSLDKKNTRRVFPTRTIKIIFLDGYRAEVEVQRFRVFPINVLDWIGSQASEANTYTQSFAVVDDVSTIKTNPIAGFSFADVKSALGRFL